MLNLFDQPWLLRVRGRLPRLWIPLGSAAAVIAVVVALIVSSGSDSSTRQRVASGAKDHASATTTTGVGGIVVPVQGGIGGPAPTVSSRGTTPTTSNKVAPPAPARNGGVAQPPAPLAVTRYSLNGRVYVGLTMGPDGNMWTVGWLNVLRITPAGDVTNFPYRTSINGNGIPAAITVGPDGNLWFTEWSGDKIGRMTPSGALTEFPASAGYGITAGPDGAVWYSEVPSGPGWNSATKGIGRITTSGDVTTFPTTSEPLGITRGSDGNLWFAESNSHVGRITPVGAITEYPTQHPSRGVALGPDRNVWFQSDYFTGTFGRVTPAGVVKEFDGAGGSSWATAITAGPDGNLWSVDQAGHVFRIDPTGNVTTFVNPGGTQQYGIAKGPGGTLWITDDHGVAVFKPPAT